MLLFADARIGFRIARHITWDCVGVVCLVTLAASSGVQRNRQLLDQRVCPISEDHPVRSASPEELRGHIFAPSVLRGA